MTNPATLNLDPSRTELKGFEAYFKTEVFPWLQEQEDRRRSATRHFRRTLAAFLLPVPILVWAFFGLGLHAWVGEAWWLAAVLVIVYPVVAYVIAAGPLHNLQEEVKEFVLQKTCAFFGAQYSKSAHNFPLSPFRKTGLLPKYDRKELQDNVFGQHRQTEFHVADCTLQVEQTTGGTAENPAQTTLSTVFQGQLFSLEYPGKFSGETLIVPDAGTVRNFFQALGKKGKRMPLEDQEFEGQFAVYTTDEEEARRLLSPTYRSRMLALAARSGAKAVHMAFVDNAVLIAIRGPASRFQQGKLVNAAQNAKVVEELVQELLFTYEVIDVFRIEPQEPGLNADSSFPGAG